MEKFKEMWEKSKTKTAKILAVITIIAYAIWTLTACSVQYAHKMTYQDGKDTVTITCETHGKTEKTN